MIDETVRQLAMAVLVLIFIGFGWVSLWFLGLSRVGFFRELMGLENNKKSHRTLTSNSSSRRTKKAD